LTNKKPRAGVDLVDLFRPYGIAPTPLHEAVQEAATKAGWAAPWDREEQEVAAAAEKLKKMTAGKKSGLVRAGRAALRLAFVKEAYGRLKPAYRMEPFSEHSMDALQAKYREVIAESDDPAAPYDADLLMSAAPFKADRDTLKKDLILLGIRSKRRRRHSG
jgi:hypothetical protein